jgi:two-component system sensor histidine kinase HydH
MAILAFSISEYLCLVHQRLLDEKQRAYQDRLLFLGKIAASIAHEVRNPLHNIRLLLEEQRVSGDSHLGDELERRLSVNLDRINRAVELVYQLAQPTQNPVDETVGCDLVRFIQEAVAQLSQPVRVVLPNGPALTGCSAEILRIVLDNLLRNACMAADNGIHLALEQRGTTWVTSISNSGTLPEGLQQDPEADVFHSKQGLGLGLFISRQLLRNCGGRIRLHQKESQVVAELELPIWMQPS